MNFPEFIQKTKPSLEKEIRTYLESKKIDAPKLPFYSESLDKLIALSTAGKMWRGLFVLYIFQSLKGAYTPESMYAAIAMELIQSALLIHDDIIDNDYTRRGQPTIFAQYILNNDVEYGKNMGICVGDTAIFMAYDCLSKAHAGSNLMELFSKELHFVGIGEMIDVHMAASSTDPTTEQITDMYRYKTARYTFSLPFMMGAFLAQADESIIKALDVFGENTGILFQIRDDSLGLTGDEKQTGKPVGADIKENKKTVHKAMIFTIASEEEKKELNTYFGNKNLSDEQRSRVLNIMEKYDIENKVALIETRYKHQALEALSSLPAELKTNLTEILELVHSRQK